MRDDFTSCTPSPFGQIQTDRLMLRTPQLTDAPAVFAIHGDPETNRHNPAGPMKDVAEAQERITNWIQDWDEYGIGYWCVTELHRAKVIGVSGVREIEWSGRKVLNLYYRYGPDAWGKGYATEVATEALKAAKERWPELPIVARARPSNESSMRVAERVGLVRRPDLDTPEHVVYVSWW